MANPKLPWPDDDIGPPSRDRLWSDYVVFASAHLASTDIDPAYPVLRWRFDCDAAPRDVVMWRLALYLTFYHLGSAEACWRRFQEPSLDAVDEIEPMRTGVERRGMRGNARAVRTFLRDVIEQDWSRWQPARDGSAGWVEARDRIEQCRGAGTWASYKWADLLKHVVGCQITADDIGLGGGGKRSGPVPGLALLTGESWEVCASSTELQERTYRRAVASGVQFNGLDQFETSLCDFNSLYKGGYYVGYDIDMMMTQLDASSTLWEARSAVIPSTYLGERGGWHGVDKARAKVYAARGEVLVR